MKPSRYHPSNIGCQARLLFSLLKFFNAIGYQVGREIQVVVGKNNIYRANVTEDGFTFRKCRVVREFAEGGKDWQPERSKINGQELTQPLHVDGVFFRPNRIEGGILNQHFQGSHLLFYEIDDRPLDDQKAALEQFIEQTGLKPAAVVFSGGKSLHVYFRLLQELGAEDWKRLARKLCVIQQSDPAVVGLNRLMRLPSAFRFRDDQWIEQSLISADPSAVYTPTQFEAALDQTGLFPYGMSDQRWKGWQRDGKRHDSRYLLEPEHVLFPPKLHNNVVWNEPEESLVLEALKWIPARDPGKGNATNYYDCLATLQALHSLYGSGKAETIAESWSPSIRGTSWDIAAKIRSFGDKRDTDPAGIIFGIAKRYGFRFPERQHHKPYDPINDPAYRQYIATEQERARCESAETTERLRLGFGQLLQKVQQPKRRKQRDRVASIAVWQQESLRYIPGCLPKYCPGMKMPTYSLKQMSDRNLFVYEAVEKGWRNILDRSGTGSGKSHYAGLLESKSIKSLNDLAATQGEIPQAKLLYLTKESRNPSTCTIEANFELLPVRHNGMELRKDEQGNLLQTPLGSVPTTPKLDSTYPLQGNCQYAFLFHVSRQKLWSDEDAAEAANNPICNLCPHNVALPGEKGAKCANHKGEGYGFRKERRDAMLSNYLRLHPSSAPVQLPKNSLAIWEEISSLIVPQRFSGTLDDVNALMGVLLNADQGELLERLSPILKELWHQLSTPSDCWGCTPEIFRQRIDLSFFSQEEKVQILQALEPLLKPSLSQFAETNLIDHLEQVGNLKVIKRLETVPNHIFWDFLNILFFDNVGTFRIHQGFVEVTLPGSRTEEILKTVAANLFLDATIEPLLLKAQLALDHLLICQLEQPEIKNQHHIRISGFGNCRRDRAESTNRRLKKLHAAIRTEVSSRLGVAESEIKIAIADYKNVTSINSDLQHLSNTRGSNKIEGYEVLIVHGLPKPNQGALQDEYACILNPKFTFEQYYQARCDAEIRQLAGRQRSDRYPNRYFLVYWITEEVLPFEAEQIDAIKICYDAAPTGQKTAKSIFDAIIQCVRSGRKLTQKIVAQLAECTQGYISRWFAAQGGWNFWKNILKSKQPEELEQYRSKLNPEERTMAEVLPMLLEDASDDAKAVIDVVDEVFQAFGADAFARIWKGLTRNVHDRFVAALLTLDHQRYGVGT